MEYMEFHILNKLYRQTNIGMDYIPIHDVVQGLKPHERSMKDVNRAVKELCSKGLMELHKNGQCISLNREGKAIEEVERILRERNGL